MTYLLADSTEFNCPKCDARWEEENFDEFKVGDTVECPDCGSVIIITDTEYTLCVYGEVVE